MNNKILKMLVIISLGLVLTLKTINYILDLRSFTVFVNYKSNTIIYKRELNKYFFERTGSKLKLLYKGRTCSIHYVTQNKDKSLTAMKVACIPFTTNVRVNVFKTIRVPLRYIILISGNKIIYKVENPTACSIRWINNDLQIILPFKKLIVNKNGKVISEIKYRENQINLLPENERQ